MLLKYFYDRKLAQASYLVGCQKTGEALVIDPARHIQPYLDAAMEAQLRITHVTETHIHADFVSGSRELAHRTGARLYLSDEGGPDWQYTFAHQQDVLLKNGDSFMVGGIRVEVMHTPGHTPEHLAFQVTDTTSADRPMGIFTGDFLFVGDVGRPDLLEEAAGIANTKVPGARQQFKNVTYFKQLPDYLQIWPGHGAGSACGKALGAVPSTTLGYEKLFNPAFQFENEDAFVRWLLEGQPEAPLYFAQMKVVNRVGPELLETLRDPVRLYQPDAAMLQQLARKALVIDTRKAEKFINGHVPGTLHMSGYTNSFTTYAGWYVDYKRPIYLIAPESEMPRLVRELRAIGVDNIAGYFVPEDLSRQFVESTPQISPKDAYEKTMMNGAMILDVRNRSDYIQERIPGAQHMMMGLNSRGAVQLPRDKPIIVQCVAGVRSQVVASMLQKRGFQNVSNLAGGIDAWRAEGLPLEH